MDIKHEGEKGMRIEDLYLLCTKCNGTGRFSQFGAESPGFGPHQIMSSGACPECSGNGGRLTQDGRAIKNFLDVLKCHPCLR